MADERPWEALEAYLMDFDKANFSAVEYAGEAGIEVPEASAAIQEYLDQQRRVKSPTLYVLRREPDTRTRNARWAVGVRAKDARLVGRSLVSDVRRKFLRAVKPDLDRIGELNPQAKRVVAAQIDSILNGAMVVLENAAQGLYDANDDDD